MYRTQYDYPTIFAATEVDSSGTIPIHVRHDAVHTNAARKVWLVQNISY